MDFAGRVISWNAGACRILGWDEAEVLWQDAALIWTQEDRDAGAPEAERHRALAQGSAVDERWHMKRNGTRVWASGHLTPLGGEGPPGFLKILHDHTKRHLTETALARSEARLSLLNETLQAEVTQRAREHDHLWQLSPDLLMIARFDGTLVAVNPAWSAILGWTEQELVGQLALELVHPDDHVATLAALERLAAGLPVQRFLNRYRHRDGSWRWLTWTALPDGGLIHATGRDVTDERAANGALHVVKEQLHQSQKMETMGQLTGGIAHDFNNLLQGIGSNLDMVQLRLQQGRAAEGAYYVKTAHKGVDRAAALTGRLLAYARRQPLQPCSVNPAALIAGLGELIERTMGSMIEVELQLDDTWPVLCDPSRLESAVLNLAINARDAMLDGGRQTISTRHVQLSEADVAGRDGALPGDYVEIAVADTGTGMTPEVLASAFEPFFTTKPAGQGTGLGLSQLHGFVQQSGGVVRLESVLGQGTTVRIALPRHDERG
jgi:PAS domain S-box-containing protein